MRRRLTDWRTLRIGRPSSENVFELDDGLVAEVERVQTEALVDRSKLLAGAERRQLEPARAREAPDLEQQVAERLGRPDRIAGEQQRAGLDPVADECGAGRR